MSQDESHDRPVSVAIVAGGRPLSDATQLGAIEVTHRLNAISTATLHILDGHPGNEHWPVLDGSDFVPGTVVEIAAGYGDATAQLFKGLVTGIVTHISETEGAFVEVNCHHVAMKLTQNAPNRVYTDISDDALMLALAKDVGIKATVDKTTGKLASLTQDGPTDWDVLLARASVNGLVVSCDNDGVNIAPPNLTGDPVTDITLGDTLYSGSLDTSALHLPAKTVIHGATGETSDVPVAGGARWGNLGPSQLASVLNGTRDIVAPHTGIWQAAPEQLATAIAVRQSLSATQGDITVVGHAAYGVNETVTLKGLGDRFNGTALISGVTHDIANGQWDTHLELGLERLMGPWESGE